MPRSQRSTRRRRAAEPRDSREEPVSLRQLEVFAALVDEGSFTRAAARLGLSQPTVSGHIADLERRLGLELVRRNRRGVVPTEEGRLLLRPAREALRGEANLRHVAAELRGIVAGTLVVGGSSIPSVHILPRLLARFRRAHPGVRLAIESGSSQEILEAVAHGAVEIAVVGCPAPQPALRSEPFLADRLVLVCAPDHPFAERPRVTRDEVLAETLIVRAPGSGTRAAMLAALALDLDRSGVEHLQVAGNDAVKAAVREGLGVSFVSDLAVRDEFAAGLLATSEVEGFAVTREFHAVTRGSGTLSPAAASFREMLVQPTSGE